MLPQTLYPTGHPLPLVVTRIRSVNIHNKQWKRKRKSREIGRIKQHASTASTSPPAHSTKDRQIEVSRIGSTRSVECDLELLEGYRDKVIDCDLALAQLALAMWWDESTYQVGAD